MVSAGRHAVRPRYAISLEPWTVFAGVGCVMAIGAITLARNWLWAPGLVQAIGIGAAVIGIVQHRPINGYTWWMTVVGGAGWVMSDSLIRARTASGLPVPGWGNALLLISYVAIAVALALMSRRPGGRTENLVDATIVVAAMLVISLTIYMFAAQAFGPNVSLTRLSYGAPGLDLPWPGKLSAAR